MIALSLICSVGGAGDRGDEGVGGGNSWYDGADQVSQFQSLFSDNVLNLGVQNISRALIQSICCTCSSLLELVRCE